MDNDIDKRCKHLSYRLIVPVAEFDVVRFQQELPKISKSDEEDWKSVVLGPSPESSLSFHAHVFWRPAKTPPKHLQLQVDFHKWKSKSKPITGVYAEDFYALAKEFLTPPTANIHVHAEYSFPPKSWQTKVLPLPMKFPYGGKSAMVDGLSMEFPSEPEGVHGAWIQLAKKEMTVQLYAFRPIEFSKFNLIDDIEAFTSVVKNLVEEGAS